MAIDFIIDKTCPVKEALPREQLIDLIKSRNRAGEIFRRLLDEGNTDSEALETSFSVQMYSGESGTNEIKKVTVRSLFQETDQLKELVHHCETCPLNDGEGFGCYNVVSYPISTDGERWLARLGEAAVDKGLPNNILLRFIMDEDVTGEIFAKLRADSRGVFLQQNAPFEVVIEKKLLKKTKVNTDQILDMLFSLGTMERTHQMFLLFFSGGVIISDDEPNPELFTGSVQAAAIKGADESVSYWVFDLSPAPSDDVSITQMKRYFRSVFAAFATGETLTMDY